jgi:hypothetical protein
MSSIEFDFEEVPLKVGKDAKTGKPQNIALITGRCEVNITGRRRGVEWEIGSVTLSGPILHDPDVEITFIHPLWQLVSESIEATCGDRIWDAAREAAEPDPDAQRDAQRDDAAADFRPLQAAE